MNKNLYYPILFLIFLFVITTQEALARPVVKFEVVVVVDVYTAGEPLCPHGVEPLNGAGVKIAVSSVNCTYNCCAPAGAKGEASGVTGTETEEVEEDGEKKTVKHEGRFTAKGNLDVSTMPEDYPWEKLKEDPTHRAKVSLRPEDGGWQRKGEYVWELSVRVKCPSDHPYPEEKVYLDMPAVPDKVTGNGTIDDPYVMHFSTKKHFCACGKRVGLLLPGGQAQLVAFVGVREGEKVQVARQIGDEVVATVFVNDEPRIPPEPDEGIAVSPGYVVQLVSTVGTLLGEFNFVPREKIPSPPGTPVIECPSGKSTLVGVPGDFSGTAIEDTVITTGTIETLPAPPGPKEVPSVTGLEPIIKTDDTIVVAGQLDNSDMGGNTIRAIDKNTGNVLGQAGIDMWRLAGASLNPPVVNKGRVLI